MAREGPKGVQARSGAPGNPFQGSQGKRGTRLRARSAAVPRRRQRADPPRSRLASSATTVRHFWRPPPARPSCRFMTLNFQAGQRRTRGPSRGSRRRRGRAVLGGPFRCSRQRHACSEARMPATVCVHRPCRHPKELRGKTCGNSDDFGFNIVSDTTWPPSHLDGTCGHRFPETSSQMSP